MIEDYFGIYVVLIPNCMTEIIAKECKSGKSTLLALGTVPVLSNTVFIRMDAASAINFKSGAVWHLFEGGIYIIMHTYRDVPTLVSGGLLQPPLLSI